ncbi:dihydroxyacetone kinase subunit L [Vagococcus penaei]|uniref:phosphoenolpyruvate--glycerone phosphotransferase n=1 Tax=Vagococcus penaei TaxID=633807 RepID=A0A1Q2D499_9ENTE|nr:dihydroxyacetone kinase subunit DhaL [Vagococcus penaei]AQP53141.1 dihydroxyacetone kinase subunit L [Vagococcus penaei]RSU05996.1 dihydroxyacetone kinase subunit L [Vagococcus penaei]
MEFTVTDSQKWLNNFSAEIEANKTYLSDLDSSIGDGDHGNNMARGVAAYQEALVKNHPTTISETFKVLSMALISKVGGASGPLYGSAFMAMAKASQGLTTMTSVEELGQVVQAGLEGIKARGKAEFDDKTMVDVWEPVVNELLQGRLTTETILAAKNHTKDLVAKKGRASYLGERAIGHIDPGAASSAILFDCLKVILDESITR